LGTRGHDQLAVVDRAFGNHQTGRVDLPVETSARQQLQTPPATYLACELAGNGDAFGLYPGVDSCAVRNKERSLTFDGSLDGSIDAEITFCDECSIKR
jgi:hypothetical protein